MSEMEPTRESIAAERRIQLEARERIFKETGLRILDSQPLYCEACKRCEFVALSDSPYRAANLLARHIVRAHIQPEREGIA